MMKIMGTIGTFPQEDLEEQKIQHETKTYKNNKNPINIIPNGAIAKKLNSFFQLIARRWIKREESVHISIKIGKE